MFSQFIHSSSSDTKPVSSAKRDTQNFQDIQFQDWLHKAVFPEVFSKTKKLLLIPPDLSRKSSLAGYVVAELFRWQKNQTKALRAVSVALLPAIGTHKPMTYPELLSLYGEGIADTRLLCHDYKHGLVKAGSLKEPALAELSQGMISDTVDIWLAEVLLNGEFDTIFSIGQVMPHEITGFSNYTKNIMIGLGGNDIIGKTHMLGALLGMNSLLGKKENLVRCFIDKAFKNFMASKSVFFLHTVLSPHFPDALGGLGSEKEHAYGLEGAFFGNEAKVFDAACRLSGQKNIIELDSKVQEAFVEFPATGFRSTWLCNKAIYRLQQVMQKGATLYILAPFLRSLGETEEIDELIQRYGYASAKKVLAMMNEHADLRKNLAAAAHLIHGDVAQAFKIVYAVDEKRINPAKIENAGYKTSPFAEVYAKLSKTFKLAEGSLASQQGLSIWIRNPAIAFWKTKKS